MLHGVDVHARYQAGLRDVACDRRCGRMLYTSALTDDEIQRVLNWLTARYLT